MNGGAGARYIVGIGSVVLLLALAVMAGSGKFEATIVKNNHREEIVDRSKLPSFEFRGHHIGDSINNIYSENEIKKNCKYEKGTGYAKCSDDKEDIGDIKVIYIYYEFLDGNFMSLFTCFDEKYSDEFENMLRGKYGEPKNIKFDTNRASKESRWEFKEGRLSLDQRTFSMDKTCLHFFNGDSYDIHRKRKEKYEREKGKSAF